MGLRFFCLTLRRHRCYTPTLVAYAYCSDSDVSRRGMGHVKLCLLRRRSRGERGPVKLGTLCQRSSFARHSGLAWSSVSRASSRGARGHGARY